MTNRYRYVLSGLMVGPDASGLIIRLPQTETWKGGSQGQKTFFFLKPPHNVIYPSLSCCAKSVYGLSTWQLRQGGHFAVQTKILSQTPPPTEGLQRPLGPNTVFTYGRLAGCPSPPPLRDKGGGLRTAVASALLLVLF